MLCLLEGKEVQGAFPLPDSVEGQSQSWFWYSQQPGLDGVPPAMLGTLTRAQSSEVKRSKVGLVQRSFTLYPVRGWSRSCLYVYFPSRPGGIVPAAGVQTLFKPLAQLAIACSPKAVSSFSGNSY